jgi:hypothetical protein
MADEKPNETGTERAIRKILETLAQIGPGEKLVLQTKGGKPVKIIGRDENGELIVEEPDVAEEPKP